MNKHTKIVVIQGIFLVVIAVVLFVLYPKVNFELNGNVVKFERINSDIIIISENLDFSNVRYLDLSENKNIRFELSPGKYYWKVDNGIIQGLKKEFEIKSEVGLGIERAEENESELVNIGNVKVNVSKSKEGVMVGHIILEPDETQEIEDKNEEYVGRQDE